MQLVRFVQSCCGKARCENMSRFRTKPRLSTTVFVTILLFSIAVTFCFACSFTMFLYLTLENDAEDQLMMIASDVAKTLNEIDADNSDTIEGDANDASANDSAASEGVDLNNAAARESAIGLLHSQFEEGIRYTLISQDGVVLYDSSQDGDSQDSAEDHSDRPEVIEAKKSGHSALMRYSSTLGEDTIYAAVALDSGDVLRLSEQRPSLFSTVEAIALPLGAAIILVAVFSILISRVLMRRIVSPFQSVDVSNPLQNNTYEEMRPLLVRIDEQQQQLADQNRELARAEDMRREFSANVSHEMKTPLQVISGYAEILESQELPREETQKFAGIMLEEAKRMRTLIDDVLALSRLDDPVLENAGKEEIELLDAAKTAAEMLEPLSQKCEVAVRVLGSTVEVMGNRKLLAQMIENILSNAIRYSTRGGDVAVMVGKSLISTDCNHAPEAYVRIKDRGCGIAEEDQEKIFERFYRVDKSRSKKSGGTGLGLAIAKHAAEFHGAYITVDSKIGEGSEFTIHFPLPR